MAQLFQIPTSATNSYYTQTVTLSGDTYTLKFRYNQRMDRWFLSIADAVGQPILSSIPLLIQRDLTAQYTTLALPPGPLWCDDTSGKGLQPGLSDFLLNHQLYYIDRDA